MTSTQVDENPNFFNKQRIKSAIKNGIWLLSEKILRMVGGLLIGVWIARYLGPEQYGVMSYLLAVVAVFGAFSGLGLNSIIVRDLVQKKYSKNDILGTGFLLQLFAGFLAFIFSYLLILYLNPDEYLKQLMVSILGIGLLFKASDVVKYWFESQINSKYTVWTETGVFVLLIFARVSLVLYEAPLIAFVFLFLLEGALTSICLIILYIKKNENLSWRFKKDVAKNFLKESFPVILVSMVSMLNMRLDQVMLSSLTTDETVGNYSAAVRIAEVWLVLPSIIGASIFPLIIELKNKNEILYRRKIIQITKFMAAVVLPTALIISLFSQYIIVFLFGSSYSSAADYLRIYIWAGVPYLIFFALNQAYYLEGILNYIFIISLVSLIANLSLNLLLIPYWGGEGAAIATFASSVGTICVSLFILKKKTNIFSK